MSAAPVFASEAALSNGAPVLTGSLYVADGKVIVSAIWLPGAAKTVADLETLLSAATVKDCAVGARRAYAADLDRVFGT